MKSFLRGYYIPSRRKPMKYSLLATSFCLLSACSLTNTKPSEEEKPDTTAVTPPVSQACIGSTELPTQLSPSFKKIHDHELHQRAIGAPEAGKLCQGQVYEAKEKTHINVYRAWNSTNPHSEKGAWWSFNQPEGSVTQYRENNEICYQWSPLDVMLTCTLKAGTKIVVGNGQSAKCSEYLTYPVSETQQVYIENADTVLENCTHFKGNFSWEAVSQ